ncbi:probable cytochrome P450 313a3 [Halyomorpha halys]|uniref:probable cytochrome P450 313a3 n=1 Tax=Halyomorpha halys TaxID=286706 RepID=UPI0006D51720|nr:probable cytochrome P450 313a3 [Halyomorpha halys]
MLRKMELFLNAILIVVLAHLTLGVILWLRVRNLYSYPGLLGFPVIGNLYYFYRTLFLGTMDSMEKHMIRVAEKYGKNGLCFHWVYGFSKLVIVSSPQIVKEIAFHPNLSDKPDMMYGGFNGYLKGPFVSSRSDDLWKQRRKEYNTCIKKTHIDSHYSITFIKCANKFVESMLDSPVAFNAHMETVGVVFKVTMETMFGIESSTVDNPDLMKIMAAFPILGSLVVANPKLGGLILTILRPLDDIFLGRATAMRKLFMEGIEFAKSLNQDHLSANGELLLSMEIVTRNRKNNESKTDLVMEIHELFLTSTNTTASLLSSAMVFLAVLPDIQERAWKEQYEIFGNDNRDPTIDDLIQMLFLDRFIKECLRFISPPFVGKVATGDINIDGMTIPSGALVIYLMRYMRMDPNHWKNPNVFDPDRFLEETDTFKYCYTPFGIGIRNCPGYYFATALIKIMLSKILRRLKLRPVEKDLQFSDLQFESCIMIELKNPPMLLVKERT